MPHNPNNPMIVQGDKSILLETHNDRYEEARDALARFAELEKSPEYFHTYRITPLSLWNAAASGVKAEQILGWLDEFSKFDVPENVRFEVGDYISRYGRVKLVTVEGQLHLISDDLALLAEIANHRHLRLFVRERLGPGALRIDPVDRGRLKQALVMMGYPAEDLAGYLPGESLLIHLRDVTRDANLRWHLRHYQVEAAEVFYAGGSEVGGSGVIVLPPGAGKTLVGIACMQKLQASTLILTPSTVAARQWRRELLQRTSLNEDEIGEYTGLVKEIRPVTISTYQTITYRPRRRNKEGGEGEFPHFSLFNHRDWGLIIYDEVHLLPAPVFRITADLQARRRLGLTATLVREDRRETDVFSLVGPKKYDVPWKDLEQQGWIATAECHEIRIPMDEGDRMTYATMEDNEKYRFSAENPAKLEVISQLLHKHRDDQVLIIGQFLSQLHKIAERFHAPLVTGETPVHEREKLFAQLRSGEISLLVVSKVANFAIDLPDCNVAIQVSGTFGSRQEEAQRLGRILRPKHNGLMAHFYALVTRDTRDQEFAANRQMFLTEQGYHYDILYAHEVPDFEPVVLAAQVIMPKSQRLPAGERL